MPRFLELFAGAGGMTMGFEASGWECVGHAEIEPHARAVLRHKWPEVPLHGDVAQLDGTTLPRFDLLTFGAPCQDLSIAGKRAGMVEGSGTRSSLFFEAIRIWKESSAPLALYENVLGAYSSNDGKDFAAVLSAFVGAAVPVPADGWRGAGVASGPAGIAAWRTVDLQHFGWDGDTTPQRRRRVFVLGTRTGAVDPAEVLLVADGLLGNLAASGEAGEGTAPDTRASVDGPSAVAPTLDAGEWRGPNRNQGGVIADGNHADAWQNGGVLTYEWHGADTRFKDTDKSPTLNTRQDNGQGQVLVLNEAAPVYPIDLRNATRTTDKDEQNRQGSGIGEDGDPSPTLTGLFTPAVSHGIGIPRRLMPIECERLMGWPDHHTATGTDEQGRDYALSDTARYKLCGNGVGSPVTAWIGMRLKLALDTQ
jgi:DNA (cytosine-5)-methyltransferase 1